MNPSALNILCVMYGFFSSAFQFQFDMPGCKVFSVVVSKWWSNLTVFMLASCFCCCCCLPFCLGFSSLFILFMLFSFGFLTNGMFFDFSSSQVDFAKLLMHDPFIFGWRISILTNKDFHTDHCTQDVLAWCSSVVSKDSGLAITYCVMQSAFHSCFTHIPGSSSSHCVTYISQDYATKIKQNSVSCTLELRLRTKVKCSLLHKVEEYKIKYSLSEVFKMLHLLWLVMLSQKFRFYSFALHRSIVCILQMFLQDVALTLVVLEYFHFSVFISIDLD